MYRNRPFYVLRIAVKTKICKNFSNYPIIGEYNRFLYREKVLTLFPNKLNQPENTDTSEMITFLCITDM